MMFGKMLAALAASCLLAGGALAASMDEMAGLWEAWRVIDGKRVKLNTTLYRLKPDGKWNTVKPGGEAPAGVFTLDDARLTIRLLDAGKVADQLDLTVVDAGLMKGSDGDMEVEFVRHVPNRDALVKALPGEWNVFMIVEESDKEELQRLPFYFAFSSDGSWKSVVTDAASGLEEEGGTYVVDDVGFLIVSDDLGGEIVFVYADGRLKGWAADADKFCIRR